MNMDDPHSNSEKILFLFHLIVKPLDFNYNLFKIGCYGNFNTANID